MTKTSSPPGVLPRDAVRIVRQPALVECGHTPDGQQNTITVIPLVDEERVMGFEVRCGCGSSVVVECVYTPETEDDPQ